MASCWLNGAIVAAEQANISLYDHGLLYGDGVFEGIRFYQQQAFYAEEHLDRLFDSARVIGINIPFSIAELLQAINQAILASGLSNGYLRLVVTRGVGTLGLDPSLCKQANVFILADQLSVLDQVTREEGLRLMIASTRRLPTDGLDPRIKSLNYLNHAMARMEATQAGADEAILLNQQGKVTEGSTDNIFIVKNNVLQTPPVSDGALAGVTRALVLKLANELDIQSEVQSLAPFDLYTADEIFLTGTAVELLAVREIDGRTVTYCPGPIYCKINQAFKEHIQQQIRPVFTEVY